MGSDDLFKKAKEIREHRRRIGNRGTGRNLFLIVCEGEQTEPNYFKGFRLTNVDIFGCGKNTNSLVKEAIRLKKKASKDGKKYDRIWCVFDRDSFTKQCFNDAFQLARQNNINIAYSNEAFELWFLLHYNYYDSAISRNDYERILSQSLGCEYKKNRRDMYEKLKPLQPIAIRNAERLLGNYRIINPEQDNPSTTVHELINELNKWLK